MNWENNKTNNLIEKENLSIKEILREDGESQISYLQRADKLITQIMEERMGKLFDSSRVKEEDLPEDIIEMIKVVMAEASKEQQEIVDQTKNEEVIDEIGEVVGFHDRGNTNDSESFDKTQRNRKFFEAQSGNGSSGRETYWNTLFFRYNTEATQLFAKKILDGKKIVLLGGGRSRLGEEFKKYNINPNQIINSDPFVEEIEEGSDSVISVSASGKNFIDIMNKNGVEYADEILAEYSVPAYLDDPEEIKQLMKNVDLLIADGGNVRIWPIQVGGKGTEEDLVAKKNSLIESLKEINKTNQYEIILYKASGRFGFILHKIERVKEKK